MNQQEFTSRSQKHTSSNEDYAEIYGYRSRKTGNMPKDEHPSTFEASIPSYSYQDQEHLSAMDAERQRSEIASRQRKKLQEEQWRQRFSPDGDALEHGYRPYQQERHSSFVWMHSQRRRSPGRTIMRWLLSLGLIFLAIKLLPLLAAIILAVIGVAAFLILLPVFILLGILLVFAVFILVIMSVAGVPLGRIFRMRWRGNWGHHV